MGMYVVNDIIIGTKLPREEYQERFGYPHEMDERGNDLVATGGAEKQWDEIVVGVHKERIGDRDYAVKAREPTDLVSQWSKERDEAKQKLKEIGLGDREVSIYMVGSFM